MLRFWGYNYDSCYMRPGEDPSGNLMDIWCNYLFGTDTHLYWCILFVNLLNLIVMSLIDFLFFIAVIVLNVLLALIMAHFVHISFITAIICQFSSSVIVLAALLGLIHLHTKNSLTH